MYPYFHSFFIISINLTAMHLLYRPLDSGKKKPPPKNTTIYITYLHTYLRYVPTYLSFQTYFLIFLYTRTKNNKQ